MTLVSSRIAPTPSGFLHIGNAFVFAITWLWVRYYGGILHLRIDDLDNDRTKDVYLDDIFRQLEWLGISYDAGPASVEEFKLQYSQRWRMEHYNNLLNQLLPLRFGSGEPLLFACSCSRAALRTASPKGHEACYQLPATTNMQPNAAWRIRTPRQALSVQDLHKGKVEVLLANQMPDFVVRRRDGVPAYQIASLTDDVLMGINTIIRGEDLLASTAAQQWLAEQLGLQHWKSVQFMHLPLFTDPNGRKLSKSEGALSLKALREKHGSPAFFYQILAKALGINAVINTIDALLPHFTPNELRKISQKSQNFIAPEL